MPPSPDSSQLLTAHMVLMTLPAPALAFTAATEESSHLPVSLVPPARPARTVVTDPFLISLHPRWPPRPVNSTSFLALETAPQIRSHCGDHRISLTISLAVRLLPGSADPAPPSPVCPPICRRMTSLRSTSGHGTPLLQSFQLGCPRSFWKRSHFSAQHPRA